MQKFVCSFHCLELFCHQVQKIELPLIFDLCSYLLFRFKDEEHRLKSLSQSQELDNDDEEDANPSIPRQPDRLSPLEDISHASSDQRATNLQSVIENSLQDLAKKEEASWSASLTAKSAISNELKNLGEKVSSQNAIFDEWEKLEQEAIYQR